MTKEKNPVDFFTKEHAERYDERNKNLSPISDNLHFLIRLILKDLPQKAKILSVGAGTGAEIIALAKHFPEWSFVAVEPSLSMLEVCLEELGDASIIEDKIKHCLIRLSLPQRHTPEAFGVSVDYEVRIGYLYGVPFIHKDTISATTENSCYRL